MHKNIPETTAEFAYSIPYEWGNLHVTEQANEAYELLPLTATIDTIDSQRNSFQNNPSVDITLVAPAEHVSPMQPKKKRREEALEALVRLPETRLSFAEMFSAQIEMINELTDGQFVIGDIDTMREEAERGAPQALAHILAALVGNTISNQIESNVVKQFHTSSQKRFRNVGILTMGMTGLVVVPDLVRQGHVDMTSSIVAGGYSVYSAVLAQRMFKYRTEAVELVSQVASAKGSVLGGIATKDIHESYCSEHFNRTFEDR